MIISHTTEIRGMLLIYSKSPRCNFLWCFQ